LIPKYILFSNEDEISIVKEIEKIIVQNKIKIKMILNNYACDDIIEKNELKLILKESSDIQINFRHFNYIKLLSYKIFKHNKHFDQMYGIRHIPINAIICYFSGEESSEFQIQFL
jgi:hypothetical protein